MGYTSTRTSLRLRVQGSSLHKSDIVYKMSSRLKLARKLNIRANGYDSVTGSPSGSEHESEDDGEYDIADACEGCNMDDDDVYEIGPIKIDPNKMPLIVANEYDSYDRRHA